MKNRFVLIYNYLQQRNFFVQVNNNSSLQFQITAGVPQGGILSPHLYSIFTADIPPDCSYNTPYITKSILYADDTIVYNTAKTLPEATNNLNNHLESFCRYYNTWKIKLNEEKCEVIIFRNSSPKCGKNIIKREKAVKIKINNKEIKQTKNIKYLGIHFTNLYKHYNQVKHSVKKAFTVKHMLYPVLNVNSGGNKKIKLMCYKQLIRPQLTYGFPIWFNISSAQMKKLEIVETKCLRQCIDFKRSTTNFKFISNSNLYKETNVIPIKLYNFRNTETFMSNLQMVPNTNIEKIVNEFNNNTEYYQLCINTNKLLPTLRGN